MAEEEALVRVKTLDGQSILVAISEDMDILVLRKLLIARSWPMLQESGVAAPHFHLVHKGVNLAPEVLIKSLALKGQDFIACVPYKRKKRVSDTTAAPTSSFADSTRPVSQSRDACTSESSASKRSRSRENADKLSGFPQPLQRLERIFTALNSVCGFLERNQIELTWKAVKSALQHSCTHIDEDVTVDGVKELAYVCSKVVVLTRMIMDGEYVSFNLELLPKANFGRRKVSDAIVAQLTNRRKMAFEYAINDIITHIKSKAGENCEITLELVHATAKELFHRDGPLKTAGPVLYARHAPRRSGSSCTSSKRQERCKELITLTAVEMVEHLKTQLGSSGQIVHCETLKQRDSCFGELHHELSNGTRAALNRIGVSRLYSHQTAAVNAALLKQSIIVSTSTASGKSLCYNIPVLEELLNNNNSCALYLFPTKALAQDQLRALRELCDGIQMAVYDGDTEMTERRTLREQARILLSNPDMLHCSILPSHKQFSRFLSHLSYVVIDEAHAYRGAFGCHTAFIIRRLRRICTHLYSSKPTFIICSATVANPREHAMELTGLREITSVREDGSPSGEKTFLLWNPPLRSCKTDLQEETQMKRFSPILEVASLFAEMVQHGLRCITFCKSRKLCELVLSYTHAILKETAPGLQDTIRAYRAGYTPEERRSIEKDLFGGTLRGVAATSALELGIDVGSLDVTLHLGFPGTIASLWQQAGRAGRREKASLSIYVAFEGPLDQHFFKDPSKLFSRPIENAQVDSQNLQVLEQHLACAALEHPLHGVYDEDYFSSSLKSAISELVRKGCLSPHPICSIKDSWNYIGEAKSPSSSFSIRAIDPDTFSILNEGTNKVIEEVEANKAFFQVYEGAIYMNQGRKYLVNKLDLTERLAYCTPTDVKYYTKTRDFTDVHVIGSELIYPRRMPDVNYRRTSSQTNRCKVTTTWIGFRRIWEGSNEQFDSVDLNLPTVSYESQAAWIRVPNEVKEEVESKHLDLRAGLHAASHALLNVLPMYIMCNTSDVGTECAHPADKRYYPVRLLIFDRCPGGMGVSAQAQLLFAELLQAALEQVKSCECTSKSGCPNCVQYFSCDEYNEVLDKSAAILILQGVIKAEDAQREEASSYI